MLFKFFFILYQVRFDINARRQTRAIKKYEMINNWMNIYIYLK